MPHMLKRAAGQPFYNTSPLSFTRLLDDPGAWPATCARTSAGSARVRRRCWRSDPKSLAGNLRAYIGGFSPGAAEVLEKYRFDEQISRLDQAGLLYLVLGKFADLDLQGRPRAQRKGLGTSPVSTASRGTSAGTRLRLLEKATQGRQHGSRAPSGVVNTAQRVEWQWKVRDEKFEESTSREPGSRAGAPPAAGAVITAVLRDVLRPKGLLPAPRGDPGPKPGGARSAPLRRVYRAQSAYVLPAWRRTSALKPIGGWTARSSQVSAQWRALSGANRLTHLGRYPLLVVDEVGYIPLEPEAPTCSSSS